MAKKKQEKSPKQIPSTNGFRGTIPFDMKHPKLKKRKVKVAEIKEQPDVHMVDMQGPFQAVEVSTGDNLNSLWVNVNGKCVLRLKNINPERFTINGVLVGSDPESE